MKVEVVMLVFVLKFTNGNENMGNENPNNIRGPSHSENCDISLNSTTFAFVSCGNQDGNSVFWPVIIFCVVVGVMIGCCFRLRGSMCGDGQKVWKKMHAQRSFKVPQLCSVHLLASQELVAGQIMQTIHQEPLTVHLTTMKYLKTPDQQHLIRDFLQIDNEILLIFNKVDTTRRDRICKCQDHGLPRDAVVPIKNEESSNASS